ncbi:MAG: 23S rRNA (uracil(1939)-C(5))-methyltransferase RlmD [Oscillospiraceae bacterium]|jgi:23S rRNA (uracil1939-C5)-methyltransferase|nr:23S rRNA (uracil(1939)-C(5))-methyltransferase RlmD [Oscillospiraceae bacterium]
MLQKNQSVDLACDALGADFEGVCRHEGLVVFVPGLLPGETGRVRVVKASKQHAIGRLEALLTASPSRQTPPCPYYPRCGGCTAQHLPYADTLAHKRRHAADCLARIGGFAAPDVAEAWGMHDPWRYRNKGAFPVAGTPGAPQIGCFAARSHRVIDAPGGCLLQSEQSDALVRAVRRWMIDRRIAPYDETTHTGLLRHVMTREAKSGALMLVLVVNGHALPHAQSLIDRAREAAPALHSVILSENRERTNVILGVRNSVLWGAPALEDEIAGFNMQVSPRSFFQVNRAQAERLYQAAIDAAELTGTETVWDVYCGCGSITLPLSQRAKRAVGVEVSPDAIADAKENARQNGVTNATFLAGAAEEVLPSLAAREGAPDVAVIDPPRKGCEVTALEALAKARPRRIVYVSCNPATLARDGKLLAERGYVLGRVQPVDLFGWTGHIELVAPFALR